jgi:hypothetical protein
MAKCTRAFLCEVLLAEIELTWKMAWKMVSIHFDLLAA